MSTLTSPTWSSAAVRPVSRTASQRWAYGVLVMVTATLFLRPSELFSTMDGMRLYWGLIVTCLVLTLPQVARQLNLPELAQSPVTACLVLLMGAVAISHISNLFFWQVQYSVTDYAKLLAYYLLVVTLLDNPARFRNFLKWLVAFVLLVACLALADAHGIIQLASIEILEHREVDASGQLVTIERLRSTGIFNDPNDLAMILVVGSVLSLYFLFEPGWGVLRYVWLLPAGLFAHAMIATQSRGGFLASLFALMALAFFRFGWRVGLVVGSVLLPIAFMLFSGRMTQWDALTDGTGQLRVQIWSEGLASVRQNLVFGIGHALHAEELGMVAHNSFLHCFVEMGLVGGSLFLGAFLAAGITLYRLKRNEQRIVQPELRRLLPFVAAAIAGYAGGMLALSRSYVVPTYLVLALAVAFGRMASQGMPHVSPRMSSRFAAGIVVASLIFLVIIYLLVRMLVRWS